MELDVIKALYEELEKGAGVAFAILEENQGSVPGKEGSVMVMRQDGSTVGTIGGGAIEYDVMKRMKEAFLTYESFRFDYTLTENAELKMACGGNAKGFVKMFEPREKIIVFGAGHVGRKLCAVLKNFSFAVHVIDDREDFKDLPEFSHISAYHSEDMKEAVDEIGIDPHTYVVIMTRGHEHDIDAARIVLGKPYAYLGMMGSSRKAVGVRKTLISEGFDEKEVEDMHLPIGLDIADGSVEEIAISVLSEILSVKNSKEGVKRSKKCPSH